jgi:hypothetical protein
LRDRKTNEEIREKAGKVPIAETCREGMLCWFGHVERMDPDNGVRRIRNIVARKRSRGRQRKTWDDVIRRDLKRLSLKVEDALERTN